MTSTRQASPDQHRSGGHLTSAQVAHLRVVLIEQRDFRVEQLAALSQPEDAGPLGGHDSEVVASLTSGAHGALRDIRAALRRIEDGSYGSCTSCAGPLEPPRLAAVPYTALCAACQDESARKESAR